MDQALVNLTADFVGVVKALVTLLMGSCGTWFGALALQNSQKLNRGTSDLTFAQVGLQWIIAGVTLSFASFLSMTGVGLSGGGGLNVSSNVIDSDTAAAISAVVNAACTIVQTLGWLVQAKAVVAGYYRATGNGDTTAVQAFGMIMLGSFLTKIFTWLPMLDADLQTGFFS